MKLNNILIVILCSFLLSSCKLGRFVWYNFPNITDYKVFPSHTIGNDSSYFSFYKSKESHIPDSLTIGSGKKKKRLSFEDYLTANKTVAFMVIKNDTILYENYFAKYDEQSIVNSFSMAKSVTSILIGCAIDDGFIKSVQEPITNYLPELRANGLEKVTIEDLLNMTSGIEFNESYVNPFGQAASIYYGTNLPKEIGKFKLKNEPGENFSYSSGDSQLLGFVLQAALKEKPIAQYLEEKIWLPLGMQYDATWSTDTKKDGIEKTFCCLNARAVDFAKIGRLYLNEGNWDGQQIISKSWVEQSTKVDTSNGVSYYQYQWWLSPEEGSYMAQGILGQYIYVNPKENLVIVRLGKDYGKNGNWPGLFKSLATKFYSK